MYKDKTFTIGRPGRWSPDDVGDRHPSEVPVVFINTTDEAVGLFSKLWTAPVAIDTETAWNDGPVNPLTAKVRTIQVATEDENGKDIVYVVDVRDLDRQKVADTIRARAKELGVRRPATYGFNANFDDPVTSFGLDLEMKAGMERGKRYEPLLQWTDLMYANSVLRMGKMPAVYWTLNKCADRFLGIELGGKNTTRLSYDATSDLTKEQIRYAAEDAVITLWLADAMRPFLEDSSLMGVVALECKARAFLQAMTINGLAFNETTWRKELAEGEMRIVEIRERIGELTGQETDLFGSTATTIDLASPTQRMKLLNEHCADLVHAYLVEVKDTRGRTAPYKFESRDSVDKNVLQVMSHLAEWDGYDAELVNLVLEFSSLEKLQTTYADSMMKLLDNGRFHPTFTQALIETGRTSSSKPNAQNFSPHMKKHFRPPARIDEHGVAHDRVLIQGDYSQAELRVSAQLTGEKVRRDAFASGLDQHVAVAASMFDVDMIKLKEEGNPESAKRFKEFRSKAKTLNFGLGYGMKAPLLAQNLRKSGIRISDDQAAKLIDDFFAGMPFEHAWLAERDEHVYQIGRDVAHGVEHLGNVDFRLTWKLRRLKKLTSKARKAVADEDSGDLAELARWLQENLAEDVAEFQDLEAELAWAAGYDAAIVLREGGIPWEFYSVTLAGRRRYFQVSASTLLEQLAIDISRAKKFEAQVAIDYWGVKNGVELSNNPHDVIVADGKMVLRTRSNNRRPLSNKELTKRLPEDKGLRDKFVFDMLRYFMSWPPASAFPGAAHGNTPLPLFIQRTAMEKKVNRLANAYRNAPIQGSVADAVLLSFSSLDELLDQYPTAFPVSTVHDSIVIECDREDAKDLAQQMQRVMESSIAQFVPDVAVVADVEVMASLAEGDAIPAEEL